jgi:hypothetical protein
MSKEIEQIWLACSRIDHRKRGPAYFIDGVTTDGTGVSKYIGYKSRSEAQQTLCVVKARLAAGKTVKFNLYIKGAVSPQVVKICKAKIAEMKGKKEKAALRDTGNEESLNLVRDYIRKHPWCRAFDLVLRRGFDPDYVEGALKLLVRSGEVRQIGHREQMNLRKKGEFHRRTGTPAFVATAKLIWRSRGKRGNSRVVRNSLARTDCFRIGTRRSA